jgi:hypothetical protein
MAITLRNTKGSALTHAELDANFTTLTADIAAERTATATLTNKTISLAGVLTTQAGTALLPAIVPTGDTNTGVWFPAADTVAVSTGGTERMRIDSTGAIGIGTTSLDTLGVAYGLRIKRTLYADPGYGAHVTASATPSSPTTVFGIVGGAGALSNNEEPYTVTNLVCVSAAKGAIFSDATVTNLFGFRAETTIFGATNNYSFYSSLGAAAGRWNFYAHGTARNYFAGTTTLNAGLARTPTRSTVASGSTIVLTTSTNHLLYDNAATAAALTVTLPSADLIDGLEITIATRSIITSLTVDGGTIYGNPTTLAAGGFATFIYSSGATAWFRKG